MKTLKRLLPVLVLLVLAHPLAASSEKALISFRGEYLAYSYDHHQVFGYAAEFRLADYEVRCRYLKIDLLSRSFAAYGQVILRKGEEVLSGDELAFDPKENRGTLTSYGEKLAIIPVGGTADQAAVPGTEAMESVTLEKIKGSLVYAVSRTIELTETFEVFGTDVTYFVEGLQSLSFKKFKLSGGVRTRKNGFSLNKVWYTRYQGIFARASYTYEREKKVNSLTQVQYEERSVLKNYYGPERQASLMTSTTLNLSRSNDLGILGNYNSSGLWNADLWLKKKWSESIQTTFDLSYDKPVRYRGETWLGFQSMINSSKIGNLSFMGRYEVQNQILGRLAYGVSFFKNLHLFLDSSYSRLSIGDGKEFSEILTGNVRISHNSRLFDLATDYYLNYDLMGNQLFSQPQLNIGLNPLSFYGGLLSVSLRNLFLYNRMKGDLQSTSIYSDNLIFSLSSMDLSLLKSLSLNVQLVLEQFLEKEGRNFTSGGFIINAQQELFQGFFLEGYYSSQSRRRTKSWLIEGTTSQDFSLMLRANPGERLDGWVSFSFDPEAREWRQSFADVSLKLTKKWQFHSLLDYDHMLRRINNVDLYLVREAGRFQLRFIWRSLTRQFLAELIPR